MSRTLDYVNPALTAPAPFRRTQHWCAVAVMVSVFPLIWMGGLVTSHGAGLSVEDWPNSQGYNMFLFPPSQWIGGIFYEHTHRLLGTLSGFLSIALVLLAWAPARNAGTRYKIGVFAVAMGILVAASLGLRVVLGLATQLSDDFLRSFSHLYVIFGSLGLIAAIAYVCTRREERRWVRWLTVFQLLLIIVQGTLGGLRVTEVNLTLAIIHACFAQAFFCLTAFTALATSRWWLRARDLSGENDAPIARRAMRLAAVLSVLIFAQLVAGALMRHNQAGLAIHDIPYAFGRWLPPTDADTMEHINDLRAFNEGLPRVTLTQVWLHFSHRVGAILVTAVTIGIAVYVLSRLWVRRDVLLVTLLLCELIQIQFTLGVLTVYLRKPADIASLHVAIGAVMFVAATQLLVVLARQYGWVRARKPAEFPEQAGVLAAT